MNSRDRERWRSYNCRALSITEQIELVAVHAYERQHAFPGRRERQLGLQRATNVLPSTESIATEIEPAPASRSAKPGNRVIALM